MARLRRQGRTPPDSTVALRKFLKTHAEAGTLEDAEFYARWLVEQNPVLGLLKARRVAHHELGKYQPNDKK